MCPNTESPFAREALRRIRSAVPIGVLALIAGCTTIPGRLQSSSSFAPAETTLAQRARSSDFIAAGRVAARDTGDTRRGFSGGFSWTHRPAEDIVELLTPLGQLAARMTVTTAGADIELSDGSRTFAVDPERFLTDSLGITLPLSALPYWLQALPVSTSAFRAEADALGRPTTLWQNGWQIQYTEYSDSTAGARPVRMQIALGNVEARMIISEWSPQ